MHQMGASDEVTGPVVSIVIVNYNAGAYVRQCLDSLAWQTFQAFEVIVVDNASADDSMASINDVPGIRCLLNNDNLGFAAGQNQGIAEAKGSYVLALNYDLALEDDFLERLVTALAAAPEAGWACGKMLNMSPDGARLDSFYAAGHELAADRFSFLRGNGEPDRGQYDRSEGVFGAPGAAALYRREFIDDLQIDGRFFDERYFNWYEDLDVDWRGHARGWQCLYVPAAAAYHVGHVGEAYREPFKSWQARCGIRNRWLLIAANDSPGAMLRDAPALIRYELSSILYVVRAGLVRAYLGALAQIIRDIPYIVRRRRWQRAGRRARGANSRRRDERVAGDI
jgi:GT2 family glycosyltransferase